MSDGPLRGVVILEFGNLVAAPYATMLLADLGARVIKVEPVAGDLSRQFGPFQNGESLFFMAANRGKESVALDTRDWRAKRVLDALVRKADAVVNNLRRGAMDRMGLAAERCRELNPTLIYATVSAFGATGPYADRAGVDVVFQGESGMISITGAEGDPPQKTATTIGDYVAGANTALAVAAALAEGPRRWRQIDVSLRDGLMAVQAGWNTLTFAGGQPERTGTASPFLTPNQVFEASDGHFTLAIVSDAAFATLCEIIGRPDLAEQYPSNADRMAGQDALVGSLSDLFATKRVAHWLERLWEAGLPAGRVLDIESAFADPQATHNGMDVRFEHPVAGTVRATGSPIHVDAEPARSAGVPPVLGEHTRRVLGEAGIDPASIDKMAAEGKAVVA